MTTWAVEDGKPNKLGSVEPGQKEIVEKNLEDWIVEDPALLGERLFLIDRQVRVADLGDRMDLLALDTEGNAVIIELKRSTLDTPVDMQALRYTSYVSRWNYDDFESQAESLSGRGQDFNFTEAYEEFCLTEEAEEIPDVNSGQRIILAGTGIRDRLGSVSLWLAENGIDIKVVEFDIRQQGDTILLTPSTIIPVGSTGFESVGRPQSGEGAKPWKQDGKGWHREKRCSEKTWRWLQTVNDFFQEELDVGPPDWNQKLYVAHRIDGYNWSTIKPRTSLLELNFQVEAGHFDEKELAKRLNVDIWGETDDRPDRGAVEIAHKSADRDRVRLRVWDKFDLESEEFQAFVRDAREAFFGGR